jgi:hypothetical protein
MWANPPSHPWPTIGLLKMANITKVACLRQTIARSSLAPKLRARECERGACSSGGVLHQGFLRRCRLVLILILTSLASTRRMWAHSAQLMQPSEIAGQRSGDRIVHVISVSSSPYYSALRPERSPRSSWSVRGPSRRCTRARTAGS